MLAAVLARLRTEGPTALARHCRTPRATCFLATARGDHFLTGREYIETIAQELSSVRGRGLLLSPADAQLALSWHAGGVPLAAVIGEVRRAARLRIRSSARGAAEMMLSLQALAPALNRLCTRRRQMPAEPKGLCGRLRAATRCPGLAARAAWESLADRAEQLLAEDGGDGYWTAAVRALKAALRELPRSAALEAGFALRSRIAPRPPGMTRRRYQRSLQLMLLSATSERLGLPPRAFLL